MSLVAHKRAMSFLQAELEDSWPQMSVSVMAVVVTIVLMRGALSFVADSVRFVSRLCRTQYCERGVQTDPYYPQLPIQVWVNSGSEVYHCSGCHHIGDRAKPRVSCTLCRNRW